MSMILKLLDIHFDVREIFPSFISHLILYGTVLLHIANCNRKKCKISMNVQNA